MFEVTLLLLIMLLIAAFAFLPAVFSRLFSGKSSQQTDVACNPELEVQADSTPKQTFLEHLQSEIEAALFPRPTDSILQRHYDALVNAELENRLSAMPDS